MSEQPASAEPSAEPSAASRLTEVKEGWGRVGLLFTIVTLGIGGYIQAQLQDVLSFWQIVWLTLPLTLAVAIIAYRLYAKKNVGLGVLVGAVVGSLAASVLTGISSGSRIMDQLAYPHRSGCLETYSCGEPQHIDGGVAGVILKIIGAYFTVYGPVGFIKAIISGVFLGWSTHVLSRPKAKAKATVTAPPAVPG